MNNDTTSLPDKIEQLPLARQKLKELGVENASLYQHGFVLRIQVPAADFDQTIEKREAIVDQMKAIGYRFIALDLDDQND